MDKTYDKIYDNEVSILFTKLRNDNNRTIADVSHFLNLSPNTYYCYEKGTRSMPMSVFRELCRFYNVDYVKAFTIIGETADKRYADKRKWII